MMLSRLGPLAFICIALANGQSSDLDAWWRAANVYQISPVSFKDSNNDGYGDIQGLVAKLDYLIDTGVDVLFLSPFYSTTFKDFGYDITNYISVDPRFGSNEDVDELLRRADEKGLKVIIDFVPNHSSNEHSWFVKSENRDRGFENFYVWHDGKPASLGRPLPPNEWLSVYGGSSWEWSEKRQQYYYHAFSKYQPDLNLREQRVIDELEKTIASWLMKGVDGFRLDAVSQLFEDPAFILDPEYHNNLPQTYTLVEKWREFIDNYTMTYGGDTIVWVPQVWNSDVEVLRKYYESDDGAPRAQIPTNFILINELSQNSRAADYKATIDKYMKALPRGAVGNWFVSLCSAMSSKQSELMQCFAAFSLGRTTTRVWHHVWARSLYTV
jgi:alpha-glucosidase